MVFRDSSGYKKRRRHAVNHFQALGCFSERGKGLLFLSFLGAIVDSLSRKTSEYSLAAKGREMKRITIRFCCTMSEMFRCRSSEFVRNLACRSK